MNGGRNLYRARDGMILGVCLGLSRYFSIPTALVRLAAIILTISTGFGLGIALYLLAAILIAPEPAIKPENDREASFYKKCRNSRTAAYDEIADKLNRLDKRLQNMEDQVTRSGFDWESRFMR